MGADSGVAIIGEFTLDELIIFQGSSRVLIICMVISILTGVSILIVDYPMWY